MICFGLEKFIFRTFTLINNILFLCQAKSFLNGINF